MALDVYWQHANSKTLIGQLEADNALGNLLNQYERRCGLYIDAYGDSKLYVSQWQQLIALAHQTNFDVGKLEAIQAKFPADTAEGFLFLVGD